MEAIKFFNQTHRAEIIEREIGQNTKYPNYKFKATIYKLTPKGKYQKERQVQAYVYKTLEEAQNSAYNYLERVRRNEASRKASIEAKRKADKEVLALDFYKFGDIIVNSWGYEQTNIQFYKVIGVTNKTIKVRELSQKANNYYSHGMACEVTPSDLFLKESKEFSLRVKANGNLSGGASYYYFKKWDKLPMYASWYA